MDEEQEEIKHLEGKTLEEGEWAPIIVVKPWGEFIGYHCDASLENMQELVGGYVEVVPLFNKFLGMSCKVLVDEEGKLKNKPVNNRATLEWVKCVACYPDYLVGDVVILTKEAMRKW